MADQEQQVQDAQQTEQVAQAEVTQAPAVVDQAATAPAEQAPAQEAQAEAPKVEATPAVTKATAKAVAKAVPVPQPTQPAATATPTFEDLVVQVKQNGTVNQRGLITAIETYLDTLAPGKPVDGDHGARVQFGFWKTLSNVLEHAGADEFKALWNIILAFFHANKDGALHERYVFRFSEFWTQSDAELNAFQRLINLIKLTANPATRGQSLKQIDLQRTLAEGFSETARQRVLSFYK